MQKLWGENYFNPITKKWSKQQSVINDQGDMNERAFCLFVLDPIYKLFDAIINSKKEELEKILAKLNITLKSDEKEKECKDLLKLVMNKFLPASDALLEMIIIHLICSKISCRIIVRRSC